MNDSNPNDEQAAKDRKKRYKKSLNLPRTSFPMKANLRQNEPESQQRWRQSDLYRRILEARADDPPFVFHDGPPYANGSIHVGHLLNKVLKDMVVRTRNLSGRHCPYIPGWDCHGLPIEHRVLGELLAKGKGDKLAALDEDTRRIAIRRACAEYATKFMTLQAQQMQRLLTIGDYDDPYLTMSPRYEEAVLEVFADLIEQNIVYRDLKPVHWSIANETALAEAELEYHDREDPSIYVWFEAAEPGALLEAFGGEGSPVLDQLAEGERERIAFMIWTTTPWTLPANLLIAVRTELDYSLVRLGDRVGVVASELVEQVAAKTGVAPEELARTQGSNLRGLRYRHPFLDVGPEGAWRLVDADYVTIEDGTGLVHTAPGHGADDYATGQREGLPVYCPVQGDGTYDQTVPDWLAARSIWDANPDILARLEASGHLFASGPYLHSYPHDWRSKTPVIFRCTEQWFIAVDRPLARGDGSLRELAVQASREEIDFVPEWGRKRLLGMVEARPDWCISRQRAWGLPIPAFRRADGSIFLTSASVRAVAETFGREGSDAWFTREPTALLASYDPAADPDAPDDLRLDELDKLYDIFDVWFESGSSWHAVMRRRDMGFPTDLYLEGSDQHRGWFQLSLLPSLGVTGKSPFGALLTHGFIVDRDGRKMSKSIGNTLEVEDLLVDFGADVCRWWVSSLAFENDIKVDREYFELAGESYRKVRNTLRFLLSNLDDFDADEMLLEPTALSPTSIDAWVLERTAELHERVAAAYDRYDFRQAHLLLFDFCNDTLSSVYLDAVKDRLYCDRADSPRRRATQGAMFRITETLCTLLAPVLTHTADEAWRVLHRVDDADTTSSVHVHTFTSVGSDADPDWSLVMETREAIDRALEAAKNQGIDNPLDAGVVVADREVRLAPFADELADTFGVSRVELTTEADAGTIEVVDLRSEPRCERSWRRDATVALRSDGGWLSDRDADAVGVEG